MVKYKMKLNKRTRQLSIKVKSQYQISEREAYAISKDGIDGLLSFDTEYNKSSFSFIYDMSKVISIEEFLLNPISREEFIDIIRQCVSLFKLLERRYISSRMALFSVKYVMVEAAQKKLWLICVPVQGFDSQLPLRGLLSDICAKCTLSDGDGSIIEECADIVRHGVNMSMFDLEEFIRRVDAQKPSIERFDAKAAVQHEGVYDPLRRQQCAGSVKPVITRLSNGERIYIRCLPFTIGRTEGDYIIPENPAISRRHAMIVFHNGGYYMRDLDSANHTYVGGKELGAGCEVPLIQGERLRLANEELQFNLE